MKAGTRTVQLACYALAPLYLGCGALLIQRAAGGWAELIALCWFGIAGVLLVLGWTARDTTASAQAVPRTPALRVVAGGLQS